MKMSKKGQSIMEYIIILTALIAVFLLVRSKIGENVNRSYLDLGDKMQNAITSIDSGVNATH